jgi:hypothetical protein
MRLGFRLYVKIKPDQGRPNLFGFIGNSLLYVVNDRRLRCQHCLIKVLKVHSMKTPDFISRKKAVVNIECNDDVCFAYAIMAYLRRDSVRNK